jgi:hypothetical protein
MPCMFGNCNDANCVAGSDTDVNGNPCDDASCSPCGSVAVVGGIPASTVAPNPTIMAASGSATSLTQLGNVLGQWGATIAGIATGTPVVSGPTGFRTGVAAPSPFQSSAAQPMIMLLLVVVVVVVVMSINR